MTPPTKLLLVISLSLPPLATAQTNLGQLLDAGAKKLSAEEFKEQLVQRMLIGPSGTGIPLEIIYTTQGRVDGSGTAPGGVGTARFSGQWRFDASGKVCASLSIAGVVAAGAPSAGPTAAFLPERCQSWYTLGGQYFLSDSDTDRQARVLIRTVKR